MGGKYVYYFLTEFDKGRLQVLPLAYDCSEKSWYNNPESGVRHFENIEDEPLDWKSYLYTFNTSCYNCHVSQLESNFDLETLEYTSRWREPGINCETCHGPSKEHIRVCVKAGKNKSPEDLKIIRVSEFTQDQNNSSCGSCHGKSSVIASGFIPGDQYYDFFSLITLEHPDFYPDGRDLGENYTMTGWEMNKCKTGGRLHCVSCHTSSGRYKFTGENANKACAPCHNDKVNKPSAHTFHKAEGEGSICISCHMAKTTFARMSRSDHSFRPPMPGATIEFGSPNACNICHYDRSAVWAINDIKLKHGGDYQLATINSGYLIEDARSGKWLMLDEIIDGLNNDTFDPVFTTSFIRLLENCDDNKKWPALLNLALLHGESGRDDLAIDYLSKLLMVSEDNATAAFNLSVLLNDRDPDESLELIRRAYILDRENEKYSYTYAFYLSKYGNYDDAISVLKEHINLNPLFLDAYLLVADIYQRDGDINSAREILEDAIVSQLFGEEQTQKFRNMLSSLSNRITELP